MLLYGNGGHSKVIRELLLDQRVNLTGIFDDREYELKNSEYIGKYYPSISPFALLIVSIGDNKNRKEVASKVSHEFGLLIHSSALISKNAQIGKGTCVMQQVIVQPNSQIGQHCILNTRSIIEHDCEIKDFVHIGPGAVLCGGVVISSGVLVGANATILPSITVGENSIVGAGSVVTKNIPPNETWAGNPARKI